MDDGSRFEIAGTVALNGQFVDATIRVSDGVIAGVVEGPTGTHRPRVEGFVAPGLCDLQVNGAGGFDLAADPASIEDVDRIQLAHGVTTYLPTLVSMEPERAEKAVRVIGEVVRGGASPAAGIHLEGPFLSPEWSGIHRKECLKPPAAGVPVYYDHPSIRMVTIAPELPGAIDLIARLRERGILVSIGHTGADAGVAAEAAGAGAGAVTHLFNAMRPLHHREPNVPGWALTDAAIMVCVIPDGHHLHDAVLRLTHAAAPERVVLVSDSSSAAGAPDGEYVMGGIDVFKSGDVVRDSSGVLAGSALTLDAAMRHWMAATGASLAEAVEAASVRPARLLGLDAGLKPGAAANLVVFDGEGWVRGVVYRGRWVVGPP